MDEKSRICLSLTAPTLQEDLRLIDSRRPFIDMVEVRADFLESGELAHLPSFPKRAGLPSIITIRRRRDGGLWSASEPQRRGLLARAVSGGYAYVELEEDLEDPALADAAKRAGARVIRSCHDASGMPDRLAERLQDLARRPGEIPKLAVTPQTVRDLPLLVDACRRFAGREKVLFGMGEFGLFSRILATRLGNHLTYCSVESGPAAAPGWSGLAVPSVGCRGSWRARRPASVRSAVMALTAEPSSRVESFTTASRIWSVSPEPSTSMTSVLAIDPRV